MVDPPVVPQGTATAGEPLSQQKAAVNLQKNMFATIVASGVTGILGLAFWGEAAKAYSAAEVGRASLQMSTLVLLATLSNVSLGSVYERFLPEAGNRVTSMITKGFFVIGAMSILFGIGIGYTSFKDNLFQYSWEQALYPVYVIILAFFAILDQISSGLGVARAAAYKNIVHALVKLMVVAGLATVSGSHLAIVNSWVVTAGVCVVVLMVYLKKIIGTQSRFTLASQLPPAKEIARFMGQSYFLTAIATISPLLVPLLVTRNLGLEQNAYFSASWTMISALVLMLSMVVSPFIAEAASNPHAHNELVKKFFVIIIGAGVLSGISLAIVGPFILKYLGNNYYNSGIGLLRLAAIFVPITIFGAAYEGLARIRKKLTLLTFIKIAATSIPLSGTYFFVKHYGLVAIGWSYVISNTFIALCISVPLYRLLQRGQPQPVLVDSS